ncbi:MAG: MBL fold metallo-hydrolase [Rhodospirillaceae bacterium]|jgi:ribonuclease Z|nr:MBL fold metallo-hydrolase [Rhodospirillaceae bacterium]
MTNNKNLSVTPRDFRDHYFPGTEELECDEVRVIALGTGMPLVRRSQASASFLIQLGNGDNFIFDMGSHAAANLASLEIPFNQLTKVFLGHLHIDHVGDIGELWISGWLGARTKPLQIWGPSGDTPEYGTAAFVKNLKKTLAWDYRTRTGSVPEAGGEIIAHEFDFTNPSVIYDKRGVKITAFPAIHISDGAVSFRLDWNNRTIVYSSDTNPNKWFLEHARNADLVIHESFMTANTLIRRRGFEPKVAEMVATKYHTSPAQAGKVFSVLKPRLAVAYHFFNDLDTKYEVLEEIRTTYKGPLTLAEDMVVWNITEDNIVVRQAAVADNVWPAQTKEDAAIFPKLKRGSQVVPSKWIQDGLLEFDADMNITNYQIDED